MDPLVKELIVLQIIYAQLLPKVSQESETPGSSPGGAESSLISSNIKLSLVKLTNEVQNNVLVSAITAGSDREDHKATKLNIGDVLGTVKELFPLQRLVLADGQLSFHNLKVADIRALIAEKYAGYRARQVQAIQQLENEITSALSSSPASDKHKSKKQRVAPGEVGSGASGASGASTTTPRSRTTTPEGSISMRNADPKREKLLQLYRDTVLNKLQAKTKILDKLYAQLDRGGADPSSHVVRELLNLEKIKTTTPISVNNLQLILQKSASDGIMASASGSATWRTAKQLQAELDDTVQFMRRALE